ncbi:shikimate dehydrogenase [Actinomycetospora endophytica]|uniref:Shikimate dehydrogenase n=1 Tax=Actinomycetospora endophytica TaxID=2291215 RepID=A0ABS8PHQ1_9PSEU|nr:shikimate dehydrogenase [Actinomycetospora endophytica]MCD2197806.1 shikimate dehydrogenase [Actinomycetospora endophytica]
MVGRRAAVLGSPVAHSLSPVLHGAAYEALGLAGWTYERVECDAETLPGLVTGLDDGWVGLSVTMPGKKAALAVSSSASWRARHLGVANTLVRADDGWVADCTDVDGVSGALRGAGVRSVPGIAAGTVDAVLLGAGGTASAAVGALYDLGNEAVTVIVRDPARAADTLEVARAYGMNRRAIRFDEVVDADLASAKALINTTPAGSVDDALASRLVDALPSWAVVLDAVYHPWPTPLAAAAGRRGLAVATGLDMLLHQAFGQVEQFTGQPAPRAAMHEALVRATGFEVRSP